MRGRGLAGATITQGFSIPLPRSATSSGNCGKHTASQSREADSVRRAVRVPITCALNGGEDYELLFTIAQTDFEKVKNHADIHFIGYVHEKKDQNILITKGGNPVPLRAQGWDHFKE